MDDIDTKSLLLDISNNLSRIGKFGLAGNQKRTMQFVEETKVFLAEVCRRKLPQNTQKTLKHLEKILENFDSTTIFDKYSADDAFTFSSILMHRAMSL